MKILLLLLLSTPMFAQDTLRIELKPFLKKQLADYHDVSKRISDDANAKLAEIEKSYNHDLLVAISQAGVLIDSTLHYLLTEKEIKIIRKKIKK